MPISQNSTKGPPRVAVMSTRRSEHHVSRACGYAFEDIICQMDFAHLITPYSHNQTLSRKIRNKALAKFGARRAFNMFNLGAQTAPLGADYDLFFLSIAHLRDLAELSLVPDWRDRSKFAVCWLQELWTKDITADNKLFDILDQFDHVICPFYGSLEPLLARISTPVTYMPWAVDTEQFCPFPNVPPRMIDVAGIGAVPEHTRTSLAAYADETGGFFHHQTIFGPSEVKSHTAHRQNYAGILKRSKYFLCWAAKYQNTDERDTQLEFGLRYVEAVAAGTIALGDVIDGPAYQRYFSWPDAVIPLSADDPDPAALIRALEADPERIATARRANLLGALNGLDGLYRWRDILEIAGMMETPAMYQRQRRLQQLAEMIEAAEPAVFVGQGNASTLALA